MWFGYEILSFKDQRYYSGSQGAKVRVGSGLGIIPFGFGFLRVKIRVGLGSGSAFLGLVIKMSGIFPSGFGFSGPRLHH